MNIKGKYLALKCCEKEGGGEYLALNDSQSLPEEAVEMVEEVIRGGAKHAIVIFRDDDFRVQAAEIPPERHYRLVSEIAQYVRGFDAEDINIFLCAHGYLTRDRNTGRSNTVYNYHPTERAKGMWQRRRSHTLLWDRQFIFDLMEQWSGNGKACFRTPAECAKIFGYSEEQFNAILEIRGYHTVSNGRSYPSKKLKEGESEDCHYTEYEDGKPIWNVFKVKFAMHRDKTGGGYE